MSSKTLVTLYHPTIPDLTRELPAGVVKEWQESGWRKTAPKFSTAASAADRPADTQEGDAQ